MALSAALPGAQALPPVAVESYPPAARDPLTKALTEARDHPDDPARVGALAMLLQAWEEWASAAAVYTRARTLERRFDWYYLGGVAETHQAHYADAAILLAQAVQLEPSSVPARLNLADALFESGALDESERLYAVLAEEPAAEAHARYGLGRVRAGHGQFQAAVTEFDAAVRLYPEFGAAWYARGLALRNLNRLDDARESLARGQTYGARWPAVEDPLLAHVRALRGDGGAHMMRGLALERQGDVAGATAEYKAAAEVNPELAQAHINLIALYGRQQEWSKAEAHYDAAVKLGSGLADANYNYGVLQVAQGKMDEAARAFRRALDANPQHAGAWNNLGQIEEAAGHLAEAEACYRRGVEHAPADATVRFNLGRVLIAEHRYADAIAQFDVLVAADSPERPRFMFGLATAHVLAGDVAAGRRLATDARDLARARGQLDLADAIDRDLAKLP